MKRRTPYLRFDEERIRANALSVGAGIPGCAGFYAVKANDTEEVLRILASLEIGFEVASIAELERVVRLGVPPWKIITSNPVKTDEFIRVAHQFGLEQYVVDCPDEVDKLARLLPGARIIVRLSVSNAHSQWPLSGKFGVEPADVVPMLQYAAERGLRPAGTTFHVGSQCVHPVAWSDALDECAEIWDAAREAGMELEILNLGGGYPSEYREPVPTVAEIEAVIARSVAALYPVGVKVQVEPGRYIVGDAGVFVTTCVATARREGVDWLFLDLGVFNGLMESVAGIKYRFSVPGGGPVKSWTIAGPTCDGFDVVDRGVELPEPAVGQEVLVHTAGAYTTVYASNFNGLPNPMVVWSDDDPNE
ncbi:MAG: type III PLP-dependent enzyme [Pseudomonadota bacterium]